jgi:hypothetical protein
MNLVLSNFKLGEVKDKYLNELFFINKKGDAYD